jgi:hypothetical protein
MGVAATNLFERVCASFGQLPMGATIEFQAALDVSHGGVLSFLNFGLNFTYP